MKSGTRGNNTPKRFAADRKRTPMKNMNLDAIVAAELARLREMTLSSIRCLPRAAHREIDRSWRRRVSVSVYMDCVEGDAVRVIVKVFVSGFPHMISRAFADGFRLDAGGAFLPFTEADRITLY